jgi:hypothetical protein
VLKELEDRGADVVILDVAFAADGLTVAILDLTPRRQLPSGRISARRQRGPRKAAYVAPRRSSYGGATPNRLTQGPDPEEPAQCGKQMGAEAGKHVDLFKEVTPTGASRRAHPSSQPESFERNSHPTRGCGTLLTHSLSEIYPQANTVIPGTLLTHFGTLLTRLVVIPRTLLTNLIA